MIIWVIIFSSKKTHRLACGYVNILIKEDKNVSERDIANYLNKLMAEDCNLFYPFTSCVEEAISNPDYSNYNSFKWKCSVCLNNFQM